uniref:Reverse transcriptase zinc-binding domain-containing protein n=1 Tax=Neogobius melanostomus TaxID=47308 RepID=A0A8C6WLN3_9GOBI
MSDLYKCNFLPLISKLRVDLEKWNNLHITVTGRINCIKMNILPRFLYLFQCLPVFLPNSFFRQIDTLFSSFIWKRKPPRIRKGLLQRQTSVGGLALPNLKYYYWAANLHKISFLIHEQALNWCTMEIKSCSMSLVSMLTSKMPMRFSQSSSNLVVISTLRIWSQFCSFFKFNELSHYNPIYNNHTFPPSLDPAFLHWKSQGLAKLNDLYIDNVFASFDELSQKYSLPKNHLFRYFQIRNFVKSNTMSFPFISPCTIVDELFEKSFRQKGALSKIYCLITNIKSECMEKIKKQWEAELGKQLSEVDWKRALSQINGTTSCCKLNLIQFKTVHRIYFTNSRLSKMYLNVKDECNRCHMSPANMTHMFWSCPHLKNYWAIIFNHLARALEITLTPSEDAAIFGTFFNRNWESYTNCERNTIAFSTLIARRRILLEWKSTNAPKASHWYKDLLLFLDLEKIKYDLRGQPSQFDTTWGAMINYTKTLKTL